MAIKIKEMKIREEKQIIKRKAVEALARYKFMMFGYYAAIWIYLNRLDPNPEPNPFITLVKEARRLLEGFL